MRRAWRQGKLGFLMLKIKKVIPIRETKKWRMTIFAMRREPLRAAFGRGNNPGLAAHEVRHRLLQVA